MISPIVINRIRNNAFKLFAGKKYYFKFYEFDWKYDKVLIGISEFFTLKRIGNYLTATNLRKQNWKQNWFNSQEKIEVPIVATGILAVIELIEAKTEEVIYAAKPNSGDDFFLNTVHLNTGSPVIVDHFQIKMEV
jgi:hypothetical protein